MAWYFHRSPDYSPPAKTQITMKRESTEWCQFYWFDTEASHLPRLLLIGDSIVAAHRQALARHLQGRATVAAFSTSKIVGDPTLPRELALALADYPIDLIVFNNGLHGLDHEDADYLRGLTELVELLRLNTRARLIWRNSTPITVQGNAAELDVRNAIVIRRNAIADEIMAKAGIPVIDLYSDMLGHPEFCVGDGFHFNADGVAAQAARLAQQLLPEID